MSFTVCSAHACLYCVKGEHFTGLNSFEIHSIYMDSDHDEQFGFTDDEVVELLS